MNTNNQDPLSIFNSRDAGNAGYRLELVNPADGSVTPHWLRIRSVDSDQYRLVELREKRKLGSMDLKDETELLKAHLEGSLHIVASLIMDWSFSTDLLPEEHRLELNETNVVEFLRKAPHIRKAIDVAAGQRGLFMLSNSQNSTDGLNTSSDSQQPPAEAPLT